MDWTVCVFAGRRADPVKLASYRDLQDETIAVANEINARHASPGYKPIHLVIKHHEPDEVYEAFRAADICVVSSLHDGMNLLPRNLWRHATMNQAY